MTAEKQAMVEKILKLLELGDESNGAYTAEQQAANDMAAKLMAKYSIDFADLKDGKPKSNIFERMDVDALDEQYVHWEAVLAKCIGDAFDVHTVMRKSPFTLKFCGTKSDIELTVFFYRYLRRTVGRKSELAFRNRRDQDTYADGMVLTISNRMQELYRKRETFMDSDSKALVVVKKDGLDKFVKEQFPNLYKSRARRVTGSMEAYNRGLADGHSVSLSKPIAGGSNKPQGAIR